MRHLGETLGDIWLLLRGTAGVQGCQPKRGMSSLMPTWFRVVWVIFSYDGVLSCGQIPVAGGAPYCSVQGKG